MVRESDNEVFTLDRIGFGKGKWENSKSLWILDRVDGERASIEREGAGVRCWKREESRRMNGGRGEIKIEREGDVGGEGVSRICEGVRVHGRHEWRKSREIRA